MTVPSSNGLVRRATATGQPAARQTPTAGSVCNPRQQPKTAVCHDAPLSTTKRDARADQLNLLIQTATLHPSLMIGVEPQPQAGGSRFLRGRETIDRTAAFGMFWRVSPPEFVICSPVTMGGRSPVSVGTSFENARRCHREQQHGETHFLAHRTNGQNSLAERRLSAKESVSFVVFVPQDQPGRTRSGEPTRCPLAPTIGLAYAEFTAHRSADRAATTHRQNSWTRTDDCICSPKSPQRLLTYPDFETVSGQKNRHSRRPDPTATPSKEPSRGCRNPAIEAPRRTSAASRLS